MNSKIKKVTLYNKVVEKKATKPKPTAAGDLFQSQTEGRMCGKMERRKQNDKRLVYTMNDLIQLLGIDTVKAYQLVKEPGFPAMRIGRRILIPKEALHTWLKEQTEQGVKPLTKD